jgi:hypothetical protein
LSLTTAPFTLDCGASSASHARFPFIHLCRAPATGHHTLSSHTRTTSFDGCLVQPEIMFAKAAGQGSGWQKGCHPESSQQCSLYPTARR